jgi:predicted signal transduction protein with EAL and GGDEF domain
MLLRRALAEAKTWPDDIRVSFNLSTRDLSSREAIVNIAAIIENSGVAASRIDLEVTETALIQDFDQATASLRTLRALGVGVSLDDFGAGYSSLSYLQRFPIDKIKIDRSFVKDVETEPSCRAIVKLVIDLCRNLKLTCIVEGMETADQVKLLRTLGCKTMRAISSANRCRRPRSWGLSTPPIYRCALKPQKSNLWPLNVIARWWASS